MFLSIVFRSKLSKVLILVQSGIEVVLITQRIIQTI